MTVPVGADPVHFELAYAPPGYAGIAPDSAGEWRLVEFPPGQPAGIVWTDGADAAGFRPLDADKYPQSVAASDVLSGMFTSAAAAGMSARDAYDTVSSYQHVAVGDVCRGKLGNVLALINNPDAALPSAAARQPAMTAAVGDAVPVEDVSIFAALDDNGNLVELGRSDQNGVYIRSGGAWFKLPSSDLTLDGKVWQDVAPEAVQAYDAAEQSGRAPSVNDLQKFFITTSE